MADEPRWYYMHGEQQLGPVSSRDLQALAGGGSIRPETQVWAEGHAGWVPATEVEGLFPKDEPKASRPHLVPGAEVATARPVSVQPVAFTAGTDPPSGRAAAIISPGAEYPSPGPMKATFFWFILLPVLAIGSIIGASAIISARTNSSSSLGMANSEAWELAFENLGTVVLATLFCGFLTLIFILLKMILLHRAWSCVKFGGPRVTPGKAVGFLFIPVFNLYWRFVAYSELARDWNRIRPAHPNLIGAPGLGEGLALTCCVMSVLSSLVLVLFIFSEVAALVTLLLILRGIAILFEILYIHGMCRVVNSMGRLHYLQGRPGGGLHLG